MNSLLAAVLDLADQDLIEERVKDNIPEMNCQKEQRETGTSQTAERQFVKSHYW